MAKIICVPYYFKAPYEVDVIDVTSRANSPLSPFLLRHNGSIMENVWQYSKVYPEHVDENGNIKDEYFQWRTEGFTSNRAVRYPMGKGVKPLFSLWNDERLDYVEARKKIYIPVYTEAVKSNNNARECIFIFKAILDEGFDLYLRDFDGYNRYELGMSLDDVINCPTRKMGHCFVIEKLVTEHSKREFMRVEL